MKNPKTIRMLFTLSGFVASTKLLGVFGDRYARVIRLRRRKKQPSVRVVDIGVVGATTGAASGCGIYRLPVGGFIWNLNVGGSSARGVAACM